MRDEAGAWLHTPPPYPCSITAAADGAVNTLPAYLEFPAADAAADSAGTGPPSWAALEESTHQQPFGAVLDEPSFFALFGAS